MRFLAPARGQVDPQVFTRPPLAQWGEYADLLGGQDWPAVAVLDALLQANPACHGRRLVEQTIALLADGRHYESRIFDCGDIATRPQNWHDFFNALVWCRYPHIKTALNARQVAQIAQVGDKARSRVQCALTHFDEGGVIVTLSDPALLALWDRHDWHGLFWRERAAWADGRIRAEVFGHALLEMALVPDKVITGKAVVVREAPGQRIAAAASVAAAIADGRLLNDPQDLRALPISGVPGWHSANASEDFYLTAPCFMPLRPGRRYPPALLSDVASGWAG